MRKLLCVMMGLALILSLVVNVSAEGIPYSTSEKADILNQLSILRGSNGDYNLSGYLKRSEAAAFIVRLMGKEEYVLDNEGQYRITNFTDVNMGAWYAPYIGYCSGKGIIGGFADGTFRPDDFISEKAFLKLVLGALGYIYEEDFDWDTVYVTALDAGIVEDLEYGYRTSDNTSYTRREVVDALYNALKAKVNGEDYTLVQKLIDEGIVSASVAALGGLITDNTPTEIIEVIAFDYGMVRIRFNEEVDDLSDEDIYIYESDDFTKQLEVEIEDRTEDEIIIKTSAQAPEVAYTIEIDGITDMDGNYVSQVLGEFTGYKSEEVKSQFFKISRVEPVSRNIVNLYFTQPVNVNSEVPSYYKILEDGYDFVEGNAQNLSVKVLSSSEYGVSLYLKSASFKEGEQYTIEVSGVLNSAYGVRLNEGEGDSIKFLGVAAQNEGLMVNDVILMDNKTLLIDFNKEVDPSIAGQIFMYYITDENNKPVTVDKVYIGGDGEERGRIVYIGVSKAFEKGDNYNLKINFMVDVTGQFNFTNRDYPFTGRYDDEEELRIYDVQALDNGTLEVVFSQSLNEEAALNVNNYTIKGTDVSFNANPVKVYYTRNNPEVVKLYLPAGKTLKKGKEYELIVGSGMQDFLGRRLGTDNSLEFDGTGTENPKPRMLEAVIISKDAIKVTFDEEIAEDISNTRPANYTLEYYEEGIPIRKMPIGVTYYDATTLILRFDALDFDAEYTLRFESIKDYAGVGIRNAVDGENTIEVTVAE